MKRSVVLIAIILVVTAGVVAQDLSGIGRDFEVLVEQLGEELLPDLEQQAIWGQYPGSASYAEDSSFFLTLSTGALITDGLIGFVDDDPSPFEFLNVSLLLDTALSEAGVDAAADFVDRIKTFFPVPILRTSFGFRLPGDLETMFGIGGFPQFITSSIGSRAGVDSLKLSTLHAGARVRKGILADAPGFPGISVGGSYNYSGTTIGYDLASLGDSAGEYGQLTGLAFGTLNIKGEMLLESRIHTFGFDVQMSKALGGFVPYIGFSPHYHFAAFNGSVGAGGEFDAFLENDTSNSTVQYTGRDPQTSLQDNNVSLVLFGGFDVVMGSFVLQLGGSWSIAKGSPAVSLNTRWQ